MQLKLNYIAGSQGYSWERSWLARYMGKLIILLEPIAVTVKVTNVFEELGIPYLIGGSLASTLYSMVNTQIIKQKSFI